MQATSKITCFKVENRRQVVEFFYERESHEWHQYVHKNGGSVEENVNSTLDTISEESEMFEVDVDGELAAFFVRYEDQYGQLALEGFHVAKEYRCSMFLMKFWEVVRKQFGKMFITGIGEHNKAAVNHLIRQGFSVTTKAESQGTTFFILKSQ
jgi:hypothetical protein